MAGKAVAVEADVQVVAGAIFPNQADSGAWTAGQVIVKADSKVTIRGMPAVYEARCTFTFEGTRGQSLVTATEDVVLAAAATKLQSQTHVLRDGDVKQSTYGNTVKVASARKLTSG
jgi:hypothetical protein